MSVTWRNGKPNYHYLMNAHIEGGDAGGGWREIYPDDLPPDDLPCLKKVISRLKVRAEMEYRLSLYQNESVQIIKALPRNIRTRDDFCKHLASILSEGGLLEKYLSPILPTAQMWKTSPDTINYHSLSPSDKALVTRLKKEMIGRVFSALGFTPDETDRACKGFGPPDTINMGGPKHSLFITLRNLFNSPSFYPLTPEKLTEKIDAALGHNAEFIYGDKRPAMSEQEAVEQKLIRGEPVEMELLLRYPELVAQYGL